MSRVLGWSLAVVAVLLALVAAWFARAPAATAFTLQAQPLVQSLQFSARVATTSRVDVGSTVTGRVAVVTVVEGAQVRQGDVLVRLESEELRAALQQAQANEHQATARLSGLRSTGRRTSSAGVAQAESVWRAAQADLARQEALVTKGFVSPARLDEAQRAVAVAQAQVEAARAASAANAEPGSDLLQAKAQLEQAVAATAAAQARLTQAQLLAPSDARVLARMVEPGQIVQPGKALLSLALNGPLLLKAQVDERYLAQLKVDQPAGVVADAFPAQRFAARVVAIAPLVDAQRGAIEIKLVPLPPLPAFLREDMALSIEVETARRARALALPVAALRGDTNQDHAMVWVARADQVEARPVRLGLRTLDAVEVLEGLAEGDVVLAGPAPAPGKRVRVQMSSPATTPKAAKGDNAGAALTNAMGR